MSITFHGVEWADLVDISIVCWPSIGLISTHVSSHMSQTPELVPAGTESFHTFLCCGLNISILQGLVFRV